MKNGEINYIHFADGKKNYALLIFLYNLVFAITYKYYKDRDLILIHSMPSSIVAPLVLCPCA